MTLANLKSIARALGMTLRCRDGEYRVTFATGTPARLEAVAYYTDCREDAEGTMRDMFRRNLINREFDIPHGAIAQSVEIEPVGTYADMLSGNFE